MYSPAQVLLDNAETLTDRLALLHARLLETVPGVDRIACALYDAKEDTLKTFVHSTRQGSAIAGYEYKLSESRSLSELAQTGEFRVLDDIARAIESDTRHAHWLHQQGYQSSFTVPIYDAGALLGFIFFDSMQPAAFNTTVQRDLVLYCSLISMSISSELGAVRSMLEATRVARELACVRDFETGSHLERMARYSRLIAKAVAPARGFNDEFVESVYIFAALHDIGKIGIPDSVLLKPGKLTADETHIMRGHVMKGVQIIDRIVGSGSERRLPDSTVLRNIVWCHHEYLDGSGYPRGVAGDAVPLEARVVTVADIYDALTTQRPYKTVWSHEEAAAELHRLVDAGKLDAACVNALVQHGADVQAIHDRYRDSVC